MSWIGRDVGVDSGLVAFAEAPIPALVAAARVERVPREVEVVLVEAGDVLVLRRHLDEIDRVPRPAQRDRRLVEEQIDVGRPVRLAVAALLELLDEADDRCVALREGGLVGEVGGCDRTARERERQRREGDQEPSAHAAGTERKMSRPSRFDSNRAASCPLTLFPA